jgi:CubicO group peptidase (beta-lactamase class C family)
MKLSAHAVVFLLLVQSLWGAGQSLPRSTPEAQGVRSDAIRAFVEAAKERINTLHSFMLVRHGKVIAEAWWKPESPEKPHVLWSLSKSFASTAVGLAVAEGKVGLDDEVVKFFPDVVPSQPSEHLRAMRVRHLLSMSGGHETEPKFDVQKGPTVRGFLEHPVVHAPGSWFRYNTPSTYMCSAIVTKVTGQTVVDYLKPRLFDPLGIDSPRWDVSEEGYSKGGYGLYLRTEDLAKFGELYLRGGKWGGAQLIPESWVRLATSKQVDNDRAPSAKNPEWSQGYGFQFWRCRHNAYRGDGRDGQICLVMPDQDAVLAITAQTGQMQAELDLVWEKLLPAFEGRALSPDDAGHGRLREALSRLEVPVGKPPVSR